MKYYLDFEFTSSSEPDVDVVCAVLKAENGPAKRYWLFRDEVSKKLFAKDLALIERGTLICFGALAECRALRSLGIDPLKYDWVDLYVEWRQLKNHNDRFNFGWVKNVDGQIVESKPYAVKHDCHIETGNSLVSCLLRLLKLDVDSQHKDRMRDLILSKNEDSSTFSELEKSMVLEYCASDVDYLPLILNRMEIYHQRFLGGDRIEIMKSRGRFVAALSNCEHIGTPIDMNCLKSLSENYEEILRDVYTSMNEKFGLYELNGKNEFVFKVSCFANLIRTLNLHDEWPKTNSGTYATDTETLERYRGFPMIEHLYQSKKTISSLRAIKAEAHDKLVSRIGLDHRLRSFFGPLGTQTGRNAAKASTFILAMSNWLRVLIVPPENLAITGIDYSSQEFAIAASLSGDQNMKEAYTSGDPYLFFAKKAGAIPPQGTKDAFKKERDLFKSTTLGLQYGMAAKSLARKLSQDTAREVTIEEAQSLIELHQKIYPQFWMWSEYNWRKYLREGGLETKDGWVLFGDNLNSLSVKNFLVQGTGASIMRRAVVLAAEAGLDVMAPLHDAIYIIHSAEDKNATLKLAECMNAASKHFVDIDIRLDTKTYCREKPWIEDKGRSDYERFKKYLRG